MRNPTLFFNFNAREHSHVHASFGNISNVCPLRGTAFMIPWPAPKGFSYRLALTARSGYRNHNERETDACLVLTSWFPPSGFPHQRALTSSAIDIIKRRAALGLCLQICQPTGTTFMYASMMSLLWYSTLEHLQGWRLIAIFIVLASQVRHIAAFLPLNLMYASG